MHGDTDQFECAQYHGRGYNSFIPDRFCDAGSPVNEYYFNKNFLFSKMEGISYKQTLKDCLF